MQDTCQLGMPAGAITLHRVFGVGGLARARCMVHDLRQCMRASLPKSRWAHRHGNPENTMQGGSRLCAASEGLASGFRPCSARMLANLVPTCGMQSPRQHEVANSWQCRRTCPEHRCAAARGPHVRSVDSPTSGTARNFGCGGGHAYKGNHFRDTCSKIQQALHWHNATGFSNEWYDRLWNKRSI